MVFAWLLAGSLATAAPALTPDGNITPEAAEAYEDAADTLLKGPPGCWEVVGTASYRWDAGRFGYAAGDAVFVGRLEDGIWKGFVTRSLGEDQQWRRQAARHVFPHEETRFVPLIGRHKDTRLDDDHDGVGDNLLANALDRLGTDVDYAWSKWDATANGVVLHRSIPFGEGEDAPEAVMDVFFPGGELLPVSVEVRFPPKFSVPDLRIAKVHDAEAKIRGHVLGDVVFPEAETVSFDVGVFGYTGHAAQSIAYQTFRPCGGDVEAKSPAVGR